MTGYNKFEDKVKKDIENKGFSYVDKNVIDNINDSAQKNDFINLPKGVSKSTKFGKTCMIKKEGLGQFYFVYDSRIYNEPVKVAKVIDLLKNVLGYDDESVSRYFRGQKAHYDLKPSLFRHKEWVEKEMEYNARVYSDRPKDFADCNSTFEKLVRLKHYDQPSRLLDLTASPLVALFFACFSSKEESEKDAGVIFEAYCEKEDEKYSVSSDTVVMLTAMTNTALKRRKKKEPCDSESDRTDENENGDLILPCRKREKKKGTGPVHICLKNNKDACYYECWPKVKKEDSSGTDDQAEAKREKIDEVLGNNTWAYKYIGELSHQCKKEGMSIYWDDVCFNELNQCILVKPPLNNDRIVRQQGCFIMCGMNPEDIYQPPKSMMNFFNKPVGEKKGTFYYVLPRDRKRILKELKILGIDEYYLFPELEKEIKVVSALDKTAVGPKTGNDGKGDKKKKTGKNSGKKTIQNQ